MAKKVKIDMEELRTAIQEFDVIDQINMGNIVGYPVNVGENWRGDAAEAFLHKMHVADLDRVAIDRTTKELSSYCEKMIIEAKQRDSWLAKFVDWITFWD